MFRIIEILRNGWAVVLLATVAGCASGETPPSASDRAYLVATLPVLEQIVRPLVGDSVDVRTLIRRPVSPHGYELRPSEARMVADAAGVITASPPIDGWIRSYAASDPFVLFENGDGSTSGSETSVGRSSSSAGRPGNPHGWTDPVRVAAALPGLRDYLCGVYPMDCSNIRIRANAFQRSLKVLADTLQARLRNVPRGSIAVSEPFLSPFLDRFGIGSEIVLRVVPEHDPSPAAIRRAIGGASDVRAVIVPSTTNDRLALLLAEERGWTVVHIDPIGLAYPDYPTYLSASTDSILAVQGSP
jgi:ABC-type Zn uptake system ZnuABC Zn-binding protein ZnuA